MAIRSLLLDCDLTSLTDVIRFTETKVDYWEINNLKDEYCGVVHTNKTGYVTAYRDTPEEALAVALSDCLEQLGG